MGSNVALVTGASSGIGLQIAQSLLERGYRVVAASRSASKHPAPGEATRFIAVDGDVGEEGTAARAVETARTAFGRLDLLVNNAGIVDTPMHPRENHGFLQGLSPAGRIGTPLEIAEAVLYLESARFVSGEVIHVDGGAHAGKWA
jgi:NAD(P)-dependent dehydrogenase (short-subunit alcohol dehydrogenase family)